MHDTEVADTRGSNSSHLTDNNSVMQVPIETHLPAIREEERTIGRVIRTLKESSIGIRGARAVYLFAGPKRRSEVGVMLKRAGWLVDEVDILRGGAKHDLTLNSVQAEILTKVTAGKYDLMLLSPPCDTFTRVKFANNLGPRPVRSLDYPHGFEYLNARELRAVELADILVDFSCDVIEAQLAISDSMLILEFPEDLGAVRHGSWSGVRPASIFQLPRIQAIMDFPGVTTGVVLQSDFGMPYVKPTRLILKLRGHKIRDFYPGLPTFDERGFYLGPAPRTSTGSGLARTSSDQGFRTTGTAAWPTQLCKAFVQAANQAILDEAQSGNGRMQGEITATPDPSRQCFPIEEPPDKFWVGGTGPPRTTTSFGKEDQYFDGCGLTSPGRWPRTRRTFPQGKCWHQLRQQLDDVIGNEELVILKQFAILACHREELFCKNWVEETRNVLHKWLGRQCGDYDVTQPPKMEEGQPYYLELIHGLLREARDADFHLFSYLGKGVTLGVKRPLPHVPALYELQTAWRLQDDQVMLAALENSNYNSVEGFKDQVQAQFEEEAALGWMQRMSDSEFRERYQGSYAISALAVLQEKDKIRVLHDGSNGTMVNHKIRCRDRQRMPTLKEKTVLLNEYRDEGAIAVSLLADASKAHRRIKILPDEWGFQACRLEEGTVWLNCVGTFGMASASYWWGRVSGGLIRCAYLLNGNDRNFDCLLFADDTEFLAKDRSERKSVIRAVLALWALGWPFKWAKFRGGHEVEWVGYAVHYAEFKLGISANRAAWVISWIDRLLRDKKVIMTEMRCGLGRLAFVAQALIYEKPLLGAIYSWVATICASGIPVADIPLAVQLVLHWMKRRLEADAGRLQVVHKPSKHKDAGDWFRTDARAAENRAYIGGWELIGADGARKTPATARWFAGEITSEEAPWLWAKKGDAQRTIAALELLASILAIILFDPKRELGGAASCSITGSTDNRGNSYIVRKMLSTKWPIMPLLIELSEQLRAREAELHLSWIPRENNQEADDLSNLKLDEFSLENRVHFKLSEIPWIAFMELIGTTETMYKEIVQRREENKARKRPAQSIKRLRGNKRLKWTSPW